MFVFWFVLVVVEFEGEGYSDRVVLDGKIWRLVIQLDRCCYIWVQSVWILLYEVIVMQVILYLSVLQSYSVFGQFGYWILLSWVIVIWSFVMFVCFIDLIYVWIVWMLLCKVIVVVSFVMFGCFIVIEYLDIVICSYYYVIFRSFNMRV